MRRAFTDRNTLPGRPGLRADPLDRLLSKELRRRAAERRSANAPPPRRRSTRPRAGGSSTTHYSVVDAEGNAVSCTTTLNNSYGSAVTVTGAGFLLNDEMDDFATAPGKPNMYGLVQGEANAIAPGKRMLSAMTPSIVLDPADTLFMVVGTPGGPRIITMVYHVISNVIDHHMTLADAVDGAAAAPPGAARHAPGRERRLPPATLDSLRARGPRGRERRPLGRRRGDHPDAGGMAGGERRPPRRRGCGVLDGERSGRAEAMEGVALARLSDPPSSRYTSALLAARHELRPAST